MTDREGGPRHDSDYLGNNVYCAHDGSRIWVRRGPNWRAPTAEVGLEPAVLLKLFSYAAVRGLIARTQ